MQTAATTAARARADGATASTAWRRSRRRAGENRPPTARTTAAAVAGAEPGEDGLDDVLRGAGAGGHADDPGAGQGGLVELVDPVDALHHRAPDVPGHLFQGQRVRRVGAADDEHGVGPAGDGGE